MEKGSLIKITVALMIICLYVYLFGIMGTIESIELSLPQDETQAEKQQTTRNTAPAVTFAVDENGKAEYTYATEINVINARKPSLYDYTRTQAQLIVPFEEETTTETSPEITDPPDFNMGSDDFDYTIPPATTAPVVVMTDDTTLPQTTVVYIATVAETTAATTTTTTAATTQQTTTLMVTQAEVRLTTTEAPEDDDIYDFAENDEDTEDIEESEEDDTTTRAAEEGPEDAEESEEPEETEETDDVPEDTEAPEETEEYIEITEETEPAQETEQTEKPEETEPPEEETRDDTPNPADSEVFTVNAGGVIMTDSAFNIVSKAVMAEISDVFDEEAIKAQAIAAYTYIKYYNLNNKNAYIAVANPSETVKRCVREVLGKAVYYNGEIIQAVYTASTAGRTASAKTVWGIEYPYLISQDTSFIDEPYDINYGRKVSFTSDEIKSYVRNATGIELSGDPSEWLKVESYVDGRFVGQMSIGGQTSFNNGSRDVNITGRVFRETILDFDIRSSCFEFEYDSANDEFNFTTYGFGHCVGFSQHGANILATYYDYDYLDILAFYYPGTTVK